MIIDRFHKKWFVFTISAFIVLSISYIVYVKTSHERVYGGTRAGLVYGITALILIFCAHFCPGEPPGHNFTRLIIISRFNSDFHVSSILFYVVRFSYFHGCPSFLAGQLVQFRTC